MDPMFHRHLVLAYSVTWVIQLGYLAYVIYKWKIGKDRFPHEMTSSKKNS